MKPSKSSEENSLAGDDSAIQTLERLIARAQDAGASDIHLQMTGRTAQVAFRLDGLMAPFCELKEELAERVFGRVKYLARLKTYQESLPQDGRIDKADVAARNDLRVATYPTVTGEKIVLRLFTTEVRGFAELAFPENVRARLEQFLRRTSGLLLLTGPAGSGKTTTIYACLQHLAALGGRHVITVEDPAEQVVPGVMQTEICEPRGLTFATAARHLLRQDPQVLVIGEVRDDETAAIAVRAALTGHLVISTLHAGSCRGVFERLFSLCPDRHAAVSAVDLVLNQRLLRRLCPECKSGHSILNQGSALDNGESHETPLPLSPPPHSGGGEGRGEGCAPESATPSIKQGSQPNPSTDATRLPHGCEKCLHTGYRGRLPAVEWLRVDDALRARLRTEGPEAVKPANSLSAAARGLVDRGLTDEPEYQRVIGE
jgi:general secretion pathway protein E